MWCMWVWLLAPDSLLHCDRRSQAVRDAMAARKRSAVHMCETALELAEECIDAARDAAAAAYYASVAAERATEAATVSTEKAKRMKAYLGELCEEVRPPPVVLVKQSVVVHPGGAGDTSEAAGEAVEWSTE